MHLDFPAACYHVDTGRAIVSREEKSKSIVTLKSIHAKIKVRFRSNLTSALPFKTVSCYGLKQTEQFGADRLRKRADWKRLNICAKKKTPCPPSQRAASVWNKRKGKHGLGVGWARREPYLCRGRLGWGRRMWSENIRGAWGFFPAITGLGSNPELPGCTFDLLGKPHME